jgi:nucleoside-diphosphate-sugar epimerase
MVMDKIVITGGAGYIGSLLTGYLLGSGAQVVVIDKLLFGGDHMLCYNVYGNRFKLICEDVNDANLGGIFDGADAVIHLSGLVGFPICQQVGEQVTRKYNTEATERVFDAAEKAGVQRFFFASTYSNYGIAPNGEPVTEDSPLTPQSLYAETKVESEEFLLKTACQCKPLIFRFSTLFGISPRTRFDLIVNQFTLEALEKGEIIIYQKNYRRSFCHVDDAVRCVFKGVTDWDLSSYNEVWNVGSNKLNLSKEEILELINKQIPVKVIYKDLSFGGDMRDITVSFDKIHSRHGYEPRITVLDGITEIKEAIQHGIIKNPRGDKYRNAKFIVS